MIVCYHGFNKLWNQRMNSEKWRITNDHGNYIGLFWLYWSKGRSYSNWHNRPIQEKNVLFYQRSLTRHLFTRHKRTPWDLMPIAKDIEDRWYHLQPWSKWLDFESMKYFPLPIKHDCLVRSHDSGMGKQHCLVSGESHQSNSKACISLKIGNFMLHVTCIQRSMCSDV